jgi:hypothetical protein
MVINESYFGRYKDVIVVVVIIIIEPRSCGLTLVIHFSISKFDLAFHLYY